jgi:2-C-methyl-D-erythritol 2,4-cyclodiphosphate synthase
MSFRIGIGYDVHRLETGRDFVLGGITIPYDKGPAGHSDGDVLIHAICDAMLGALALGDIGKHFPDTEEEFRGIDSKIRFYGYEISNIDATVCLQRPKIAGYVPLMVKTLSDVLHIDGHQVSIKATTTEKMGFVGEELGISAYAVVLLVLS